MAAYDNVPELDHTALVLMNMVRTLRPGIRSFQHMVYYLQEMAICTQLLMDTLIAVNYLACNALRRLAT